MVFVDINKVPKKYLSGLAKSGGKIANLKSKEFQNTLRAGLKDRAAQIGNATIIPVKGDKDMSIATKAQYANGVRDFYLVAHGTTEEPQQFFFGGELVNGEI